MSSSPIAIIRPSAWDKQESTVVVDLGLSTSASSSASTGVYVPVHKRGHSSASSTASSHSTFDREHDFDYEHNTSRVYSISDLLSMRDSELSRLDKQQRENLRAEFPEIIMNRRQRKFRRFAEDPNLVSPTPAPAPASTIITEPENNKPTTVQAPKNVIKSTPKQDFQQPRQVLSVRRRPAGRAPPSVRRFAQALKASDNDWRARANIPVQVLPISQH